MKRYLFCLLLFAVCQNCFCQDLLARQAPIDKKMKEVDTINFCNKNNPKQNEFIIINHKGGYSVPITIESEQDMPSYKEHYPKETVKQRNEYRKRGKKLAKELDKSLSKYLDDVKIFLDRLLK